MNEEFEEEVMVLESIYGTKNNFKISTINGTFVFSISFSNSYPACMPSWSLSFPQTFNKIVKQKVWERNILDNAEEALYGLFTPGEVCLFKWIEWLRDYLENLKDETPSIAETVEIPKGYKDMDKVEENGFILLEGCPTIHHSLEPIVEKKSVFVGHIARIQSLSDIELVKNALLSNRQVAKATHNISAYVFEEGNGILKQDFDDDGENGAGNRLLKMLQSAGVLNVYVMVSRWYGGIQLGTARFRLINNTARSLLSDHLFL
jgi:hypothetical protein